MQNYIILKSIKNQNYCKNVFLCLEGKKEKLIGKIDLAGEGTFTTNRNETHLLRKTNSLGLSYGLLSNESIKFKWIVISYLGKKLVTSREFFLRFGTVMQFKNFELQVFLPLDLFGIEKARKLDELKKEQINLFDEIAA